MDPVTAPAASGANVAVNVLTWPAVNVNGVVIPEMLNPVPAAVAEENRYARGSAVRQRNRLRPRAANRYVSECRGSWRCC